MTDDDKPRVYECVLCEKEYWNRPSNNKQVYCAECMEKYKDELNQVAIIED